MKRSPFLRKISGTTPTESLRHRVHALTRSWSEYQNGGTGGRRLASEQIDIRRLVPGFRMPCLRNIKSSYMRISRSISPCYLWRSLPTLTRSVRIFASNYLGSMQAIFPADGKVSGRVGGCAFSRAMLCRQPLVGLAPRGRPGAGDQPWKPGAKRRARDRPGAGDRPVAGRSAWRPEPELHSRSAWRIAVGRALGQWARRSGLGRRSGLASGGPGERRRPRLGYAATMSRNENHAARSEARILGQTFATGHGIQRHSADRCGI
jgi:hypothetical protein